jgi:hypothetical protein
VILRLVKRDRAWQMALMLAVAIGVAAPLFPSDLPKVISLQLVSIAFLGCSLYGRPHVRATLFEAALPITGRDLFLARTLSLLAMVWLPVLCAVITTLLVRADGALALAMVEAAAIFTPAILLQQNIRIQEIAGPQWSPFFGVLFWAAGGLTWHFLMPGVELSVCSLVGALVSAAVLIRTWFSVPPSFQVVSLRTVDPIAFPESVPALFLPRKAFTWLPVLRSFWWGMALFFLLMALQGMEEIWFYYLFFIVVYAAVQSRRRTRWLFALPLSCRALLWITLIAAVGLPLAGLAVGMCIGPIRHRVDYSMVDGPKLRTPIATNVPLEFWHYAPSGKVPVIRAPWGETVEPATFRALGFTFYNPYSVGSRDRLQLLDWQFGRATEAAYGRSITSAQYSFNAAARSGLRPRTDSPRTRILTLEAALLIGLFLVFATELFGWHVLHRPQARGRAILTLLLCGIPIAAACGVQIYYMYQNSISIAQALVHFVLLRVTSTLPSTVLAATAGAVLVGAMYWLLERQFRKSELPMWKRPGQPE